MVTYYVDNIDELMLFQYLLENTDHPIGLRDVPILDFEILGFIQHPWGQLRGKRTERLYKLEGTNDTVVEDMYTYTYKPGTNIVQSYTRKFRWLQTDTSLGIEKDYTKIESVVSMHQLNIQIRQNQIDYLVGAGEQFGVLATLNPFGFPQSVVDDLAFFSQKVPDIFLDYESIIVQYVQTGSDLLFNTIENESRTDFVQAFNIIDPTNPDGWSMGKTMLNELVPDSYDLNTLKNVWST